MKRTFQLAAVVIATWPALSPLFAARPAAPEEAVIRRIYDEALSNSPTYEQLRTLTTRALDDHLHTGSTSSHKPESPTVPAAALSTVAANALSQALAADPGLRVEIVINAKWHPDTLSHNVVGEIRGSEFPNEIIVVGGHLDSWDISPDAHDDRSGIAQSLDVLRIFKTLGLKPRHTLRAVLFTAEENGARRHRVCQPRQGTGREASFRR
ncbi:MAG: M28 family peptidase [Verrucomicrobia bacterium]|nr:M28 family peptidase [Verrucomicrobiota bacterium]